MIKDTLRESLTRSVRAEISSETERFVDRQVSLDHVDGGTRSLVFSKDMTTTSVQHTVDTTSSNIGALNFDKINGLLETRLSSKSGSIQHTTSGGDDLTTTTMNSVSVKGDIQNVKSATSHVFVTENTLLGGPLEGSNKGILNFVQVLHGLGGINQNIGTRSIRSKTPNLTCLIHIPVISISQITGTSLVVVTVGDLSIFNILGQIILKRLSSTEETVVLVGRLGETSTVRSFRNSLTVRHNRVSLAKGNLSVFFFQILQTDFQMQLTGTGNNVLTRLSNGTNNTRVRLRKTFQTLNKLGEITSRLGLNSNTHNRGDRELHDTDNRSILVIGDGTTLQKVLINTDKTNGVTTRTVVDRLSVTSHHQNSSLDGLEEEIGLSSLFVVRTQNSDLLSSLNTSREDTSESIKSTLVVGGHHLGDVHHKRTIRITVSDTLGSFILHITSVQVLDTVFLGNNRGRKMQNDHLKKSITSREKLTHDSLQKRLANLVSLFKSQLNTELFDHLLVLGLLIHHDVGEKLLDWLEDKLAPSTLELLSILGGNLDPLLGSRVKVVLSPHLLHQTVLLGTELLRIHTSELGQSESPSMKTRTESNSSLSGVNQNVSELVVTVSSDDDVDVLNNLVEGLVTVFWLILQLKEDTVHLVDHKNGLHTLTKSLTQHSLGLDTDTLDTIDNNQSSVSDTKSSSNFRGEIDVPGRVDQVDQKTLTGILVLRVSGVNWEIIIQRNTSRLDGDTTILFILTSVSETSFTGLIISDNTGLRDQRISEGGLSVIDVSDDTHVTDVLPLLHLLLDLIDGETHHFD
mmetsp:Transcript_14452/g.20088  ORF Transcript_14452/g.20088 Transcript_14452/m.20088 type:complete len:801 (+) Transcript_14452:187-2589(+)